MAIKVKFANYFKFFIISLFVAFALTLLIGYFCGFKYILVNGWSAQQKIPYQSMILTYKCSKEELQVNDFATTKLGNGYVTHQVIGMKYEGYFELKECYSWEMNGETYHSYYGYQVGSSHDITAKPGPIPSPEVQEAELENMQPSSDAITNCNLITMANSEDGNARKEYKNFENEFVGRVIWHNYTLGKTFFILKDPEIRSRVLLLGIVSCIIMVFVMAEQSKLKVGFYD